jgi:TetR/AcrR family transcriptional regulator, copper-responsive repressor
MSSSVQKSPARRGRPRAYDPETALAQAMAVFWNAGYSATSLDDLSAATGMNRPSLYGAFGDKRELYRTLLRRYRGIARAGMKDALRYDLPLREALRRVYHSALALYLPPGAPARGCFLIGTAVTESVLNGEVRTSLAEGLAEIDRAFEARLRFARQRGELPPSSDPGALASMASATLYSLAIRSRSGLSRAALLRIVDSALDLICGTRKRA